MRFDRHGALLADVPNSGITKRNTQQKSGNKNFDSRSGKFAAKPGGKPKTSAPANVDPAEYARYLDAVREAARKFPGQLSAENLQSFIQSRAANPAAVNIQQFAALVGQQQINDLIDSLDQNHGGFKVTAPQGFIAKVVAGLSDDNLSEVIQRMKARGIKDPYLKFGRVLPKEKKDALRQLEANKADVQAADTWDWSDDDDPVGGLEGKLPLTAEDIAVMLASAMEQISLPAIHVAAPEVTVQPPEVIVNVPPPPEPQRFRKVVERDEKGLIVNVTEEPV